MARDHLSDNWRRTRCRFAFLFFCLLPTAISIYWILHPQTVEDWQRTIQAELGLPTTIDSIETPGPNVTILRGVKFTDSRYGLLFGTTQIRVIRGTVNRVVVDYPTRFSSESLAEIISLVSDHMVRGDRVQKPWTIEFNDTVRVFSESFQTKNIQPLDVKNLTININRLANGPAAEIGFRVDTDPARNLFHGYFHNGLDSNQKFGLDTSGSYLPCWLLSDIVPDLKRFGNNCRFNGRLDSEINEEQVTSQFLDGHFANIDLSTLVQTDQQELQGDCTAHVSNFVIENGLIHSLVARVWCPEGTISSNLLRATNSHLGFQLAPDFEQLGNENGLVFFRNMQLNIGINDGMLFLSGNDNGNIAYDNYGRPLTAFESINETCPPRPLIDLAKFLIQPNAETELLNEDVLTLLGRFQRNITPIRLAKENNSTNQY